MGTVPWSIGSQQAGLQTHVLPLPALEIQDRVPGNRRKPRQSWGWTGCPLPRRPSPSGCLAVPLLSLRKAREPTCLWEGLECPPTWSRNSAQTPEKAYSMDCKRRDICFSFGSEGKQMGKGNWWKDVGAAERLRPHTRSLQVNTSELPLEVFLQGMPYFSFFLSFFLSFFFFFFLFCRGRKPLQWAPQTWGQEGGEEGAGPSGMKVVAPNCSRTLEESSRSESRPHLWNNYHNQRPHLVGQTELKIHKTWGWFTSTSFKGHIDDKPL